MSALTKKHPTNTVETVTLLFEGPATMRHKALTAMQEMGFTKKSEGTPWKEALGHDESTWPQTVLKGGRTKEGLTQKELSELTGIPRTHISDMERGRRPIGKQTARKLSEALNLDARLFLSV